MRKKFDPRWRCSKCYDSYVEKADAESCCPNPPDLIYWCRGCGDYVYSAEDVETHECKRQAQVEFL